MTSQAVDKALQGYIAQLNTEQKESLLHVIRSFLTSSTKENSRYTEEELAHFYERRNASLHERSPTYSIEESHTRIRQNRPHK